jgi:hypothetical protein
MPQSLRDAFLGSHWTMINRMILFPSSQITLQLVPAFDTFVRRQIPFLRQACAQRQAGGTTDFQANQMSGMKG